MDLAPVVLFTYNRPWHTEQTLNALKLNKLARNSTLYIYCDGPKENATEKDLDKIFQVRKIVKKEKWCRKVHIIEHKINQGLAHNILTGITKILQEHDKIIVLEDDIVTSKLFLSYMNSSLNYYQKEERVYHINGYNNQSNLQFILDDYYFLHFMFCWGWATWKDRWKKLDRDYLIFYDKLKNDDKLLKKFNYGNKMRFQDQLLGNINKKINTWAVLWNCSIFFNNGYCLTSKNSYVLNIGLDGTGEHCDDTKAYQNIISENIKPFNGGIEIAEKLTSRTHLELFFQYGKKFNFLDYLNNNLRKVLKP